MCENDHRHRAFRKFSRGATSGKMSREAFEHELEALLPHLTDSEEIFGIFKVGTRVLYDLLIVMSIWLQIAYAAHNRDRRFAESKTKACRCICFVRATYGETHCT